MVLSVGSIYQKESEQIEQKCKMNTKKEVINGTGQEMKLIWISHFISDYGTKRNIYAPWGFCE